LQITTGHWTFLAEIFKPKQQLKLWQEKRSWFTIPLSTPFPALIIKEVIKMIRCTICGAPIKPWFEVCYQCYTPTSKNAGRIPEPIIANKFMKGMGIYGWK